MATFALIVMAIGSWALVIGMIATLGRLYTASHTTAQETAGNSAPNADKVVYLDNANNAPAEQHAADIATRAAA